MFKNDYVEGDIIVSLKGNTGAISIATWFECSHIPGNFRKVTPEDRLVLNPTDRIVTIDKKLSDIEQTKIKLEMEIRIMEEMVKLPSESDEYKILRRKLDTLRYGVDLSDIIKSI